MEQIDFNTKRSFFVEKQAANFSFLVDILDFFTGARSGHVDAYGYSTPLFEGDPVCGSALWGKFIETHQGYYPYRDECRLIPAVADRLKNACHGLLHFIELGAGSPKAFKQKTLPFLHKITPVDYTVVDVSEDFSASALTCIKKENLPLVLKSFSCNFFEELPRLPAGSLLYLVGSTISNIPITTEDGRPESSLEKALQHFALSLVNGGALVLTFDTNQNEASILNAYTHPIFTELNVNFIDRIKRDLPTKGLNTSDFEHVMSWDADRFLLTQDLRARRDLRFSIADVTITLRKGELRSTSNCIKFPEAVMREAGLRAGFTRVDVFGEPWTPMKIAVMRR